MSGLPTNARWIDPVGSCYICRAKQAVGVLMSDRNDRIGPVCQKCGDKAIKNYGKATSPTPQGG